MDHPLRVAVCGQSIAWAAVEAALSKSPNIELTRVTGPELGDNLPTLEVDVVIFEQATLPARVQTSRSDLTLIGLDFGENNLVAHLSRADTLTTLEDLTRVIRTLENH